MENSPIFDIYNMGKRSIVIDYKTPEGMEVFEKLLEKANAAQKTLSGGGDPAEAIGALETAWADTQHHLRLLMPNAPLMDLNEAIARLYPEYEQGSDGLSAELASIAADLSWLRGRCGFRVL